jgi:hypothetical protein
LKLNSHDINATEIEKYLKVAGVAEGSVSEENLSDWIRDRLVAYRQKQ